MRLKGLEVGKETQGCRHPLEAPRGREPQDAVDALLIAGVCEWVGGCGVDHVVKRAGVEHDGDGRRGCVWCDATVELIGVDDVQPCLGAIRTSEVHRELLDRPTVGCADLGLEGLTHEVNRCGVHLPAPHRAEGEDNCCMTS